MNIRYSLALGIVMLATSSAMGATASQKYTVTVPTNVSITAPSDVVLTHDESENNQAFPAQQWTVKGNTLAGVSVSFSTNQAFTHVTDSSFKRNARLDLSVASNLGPATWSVSQANDVTNYASSDGVATVQAASNGVGRATFDLAVTFITDGYGTFASGAYETTVTGTVTAN